MAQTFRERLTEAVEGPIAVEWAYLAAVLDGEGSITLSYRQGGMCVQVQVQQTNEAWLLTLQKMAAVGKVSEVSRQRENWSRKWVWYVAGGEALSLLRGCLPYLRLKREEALAVLEAASERPKWAASRVGRGEADRWALAAVARVRAYKTRRRGATAVESVEALSTPHVTGQPSLFEIEEWQ